MVVKANDMNKRARSMKISNTFLEDTLALFCFISLSMKKNFKIRVKLAFYNVKVQLQSNFNEIGKWMEKIRSSQIESMEPWLYRINLNFLNSAVWWW